MPDSSPLVSLARLLEDADRLLPEFEKAIEKMAPRDRGRGIYASEMFFFYAVVRQLNPDRILESGRARGGSTLTLAHCFPDAVITSIEYDAASPDAAVALEKLAPFPRVKCIFGDSRELLPKLVRPGDPVLIDGPKDFRGLKLALQLLHTGKPAVVFLHDFGAASAPRRFLDRHWPGAIFSDAPEFLRRFAWLDDVRRPPRAWDRVRHTTFACLPPRLPAPYHLLLARLVAARAASLAPQKVGGLARRVARKRH